MNDFKRGGGFNDKKRGGFDRRDSGSRGFSRGGFSGGDSARPQMHSATCAECGKSCEVPFKPSGDRPIYCSNCFKSKKDDFTSQRPNNRDFSKPRFESPVRPSAPTNSGAPTSEQFAKLNAKLDSILDILNSISVEEDEGDYDDGIEEIKESPTPVKNKKESKTIKSKKPEVKKPKRSKKR